MKYSELNVYHPDYDATKIKRYDLLYEGGDDIIDNAKEFIHREPQETETAYKNRLKYASYKNYMAQIINGYVADLFSKKMVIVTSDEVDNPDSELTPQYYKDFEENADGQDNALSQVLRELVTEGMIHGHSFLGVDFPKASDNAQPQTLVDEETSGADRAYVFPIDNSSVVDWDIDDFGMYRWLILRTEEIPKTAPTMARDKKVIKFKVWTKDKEIVSYQVWQIVFKADLTEPGAQDPLTLVDEGTVSFTQIPVVRLCFKEELKVGCLIGAQCANLFRRTSALLWAQGRSLFAVLVFKQGPEYSDKGGISAASENPYRGQQQLSSMNDVTARGGMTIGSEDDVSFVEPTGASFALAHENIKDDVEELNRVTHTMAMGVAAQTKALGRSGTSKQMDNKAKDIVLSAFAEVIKDFVRKLYNVISAGRNEAFDFRVLGMDNYRIVDREQTITEAVEMASVDIPSPTFLKHWTFRLASDLEEDLPPDVMLKIHQEIEGAVDIQGWRPINPAQLQADLTQAKVEQQKGSGKPTPKSKKAPSKKK